MNHRRSNGLDLTVSDHSVGGVQHSTKEEQQTASVETGCASEPPSGESVSCPTRRSSVGFPICHMGGLDELTSEAYSSFTALLDRQGHAFQFPFGDVFRVSSKAFRCRFPHPLYLHEVCCLWKNFNMSQHPYS